MMKTIITLLLLTTILRSETLFDGFNLSLRDGERVIVPVTHSQIMCLGSDEGLAIVSISYVKANEYMYKFRYYDRNSGKESRGQGSLIESYKKIPRDDGGFDVKDMGSKLDIVLQEMRLVWSFGDRKESYVYFKPGKFDLRVLDASYYERIKFDGAQAQVNGKGVK